MEAVILEESSHKEYGGVAACTGAAREPRVLRFFTSFRVTNRQVMRDCELW